MDRNKSNEELIDELKSTNKVLNSSFWTIIITNTIFLIIIGLIVENKIENENIIMAISVSIFVISCFAAVYYEISSGYYVCEHCNYKFKSKYMKALLAPHAFTKRYLRCPNCNKKSYAKREI